MIQRYDSYAHGIDKDPEGGYVAFEDYKKLEQELEGIKEKYRWRDVNEELPEPNALVWCRRRDGRIILSIRGKEPLSTNPDPWRNCFWHSVQMFDFDQCGPCKSHWSDVTVRDWCYLEKPQPADEVE